MLALEAGDEVPCPLCGQMTDDPKFCGFCGDIEEATKEYLLAQEAKQDMENEKGKKGSFRLGSVSFGGSTSSPKSKLQTLRVSREPFISSGTLE